MGNFLQAATGRYKPGRSQKIKYVVIHYTGNNGDTAVGNARYFHGDNKTKTSAHYFVDENEVWQSVKESDTAYHCGAKKYWHKECRNANSIGIEMVSCKDKYGRFYIKPEVVKRAAELTRQLMKKYSIDSAHVLRHYDVTGKKCPEPFVRKSEEWVKFRQMIVGSDDSMTQEEFNRMMGNYKAQQEKKDPQEWSWEARKWAEKNGIIKGNGTDMAYQSPVTREELVTILYRFAQK